MQKLRAFHTSGELLDSKPQFCQADSSLDIFALADIRPAQDILTSSLLIAHAGVTEYSDSALTAREDLGTMCWGTSWMPFVCYVA